jgi:predicted nucleotidyltransferase
MTAPLGELADTIGRMSGATLPDSRLGRLLAEHRAEVVAAAAARGASNVRVFGSVARGEDDEASDIDLLVDMNPRSLLEVIALEREVAAVLGVPVDLGPVDTLRPSIRDAVLAEAIAL